MPGFDTGTGGGGAGVSDHGALSGLADDDHSQYHNNSRGDARYPLKSNNLSDLANAGTARTNLGLGGAASLNVGTTAGTVAAGDDSRFGRVDFLRFDAADFIPRTTNGCGVDSTETATNLINRDLLLFDAATAEFAQAWFLWPDGWNTATATFFWHGNGTADVVWSARIAVFSDGDAIDSAFGTAQTVTDSAASANTHRQSAATPAITPSGTVGARKRAVLGISRDATNGADTLAVDACLSGVLLERAS